MLNIPTNVRLILGGVLAALVPLLQYALKVEPTWVWVGPLLSFLLYVETTVAVPDKASAKIADLTSKLAKPIGVLVLACGLATAASACGTSVWDQLTKTVLADLENGSALSTLEGVVAQLFPAIAGDAVAVDTVLQAVIDELVATGVLPAADVPKALAVREQVKAKLAGAKASGWAPSAEVRDVVASLERRSRDPGEVLRPEVACLVDAVRGEVAR